MAKAKWEAGQPAPTTLYLKDGLVSETPVTGASVLVTKGEDVTHFVMEIKGE